MSVAQQRVITRRSSKPVACIEHGHRRTIGCVRPMRVALSLTPDGVQALVSGEMDFSTAPRLDRLLRMLEGFAYPVSFDLSGVSFTDSTGLSPLFGSAARRAATGAPAIRVTALSKPSRRVLDLLANLDDVRLLVRVGLAR